MRRVVYVLGLISLTMSAQSCEKSASCVARPKKNCICTTEYNPVCGCDQKTYNNACEASCHGITSYTSGPCSGDGNPND